MRIGDKVRHKRREGVATVIDLTVKTAWDDFKNRTMVNTTYTARYDDGSLLRFYGFNIGKTIFKVEDFEQLSFLEN